MANSANSRADLDTANARQVDEYARWFRESTPYISAHRGKTFVVLLGGDTVANDNLVHIVHDLALLTVLGVRLVVVHGARPQIDAATESATFHGHRRITDGPTMALIHGVNGKIRATIEALFSTGLPGSPLHNTNLYVVGGNFVTARPVGVIDGVDHLNTGSTRSVDAPQIRALANDDVVPLISPVGYSPSGTAYNLSADELAADVALALGADKLIAFSESPFVQDARGIAHTELTPAQLDKILDEIPEPDPQHIRLAAILRASRGGIRRCHIVSHRQSGALLGELFTANGRGTQISEEDFRRIRPATTDDVAGIVELIRPLEAQGVLIERPRDRLESEIGHFLVAEIDGIVVGCCALYPYGSAAEFACLAVHATHRSSSVDAAGADPGSNGAADNPTGGLGAALLAAAEQTARADGVEELFVLTTQARDWFVEQGFTPSNLAALPMPKQSLYNYQRNALVLTKNIS